MQQNCENCGREVTTPFCPQCGTATPLNPGLSLLQHCRHQVDVQTKTLQELINHGHTNNEKRERHIAKWQGWADFVEKACGLQKQE